MAYQGQSQWAKRMHQLSVETTLEQRRDGGINAAFTLVAGPGTHWVRWRGAWLQVSQTIAPLAAGSWLELNGCPQVKRDRNDRAVNPATGRPWETVTLTTLSAHRDIFPKLLLEARDLALQGQEGKLLIYTHWQSEWRAFGPPRMKRPLSSVVLADGVAEKIEADVVAFLARKQWYARRGRRKRCRRR